MKQYSKAHSAVDGTYGGIKVKYLVKSIGKYLMHLKATTKGNLMMAHLLEVMVVSSKKNQTNSAVLWSRYFAE